MEHADTAQLAALGGALGSVLVLLARGRPAQPPGSARRAATFALLAGLVLLAAAELGLAWALGGGPLDRLGGASAAAAVGLALVALGAASALFAQRPALVPIAVLVTAPLRPPLSFDSSSALLVRIADDGSLGPAGARNGRAGSGHTVRCGGPLAGGHPRALLLRAQPGRVECEHGLFPCHLAVRRPQPLRAPRGAGDRRGARAARNAALAGLAADRPDRSDVGRAAVLVLAVEHGRAARDHGPARRHDR